MWILRSRRMIATHLFAALGIAFLAPCSQAQTWSFSGTEACYHYHLPNTPAGLPDQVQCFARGTLLSLTSPSAVDQSYQQHRSYEAGRQLGSGVGSLIVVLIRAWEAHHKRVVVEAKAVQQQIEIYLRANMALFDEQIAMMNQDLDSERQLQEFEPDRREKLIELQKDRTDLIAKMTKLRENVHEYECKSVTGKQPRKDLHYALTGQGGAEWTYNLQREQLVKEWVLNRSLALLVASYQGKEIAEPPRTTQTYENVCQW
jgi:hypothetical protein